VQANIFNTPNATKINEAAAKEIAALSPDALLYVQGEYRVYMFSAMECLALLEQIGQLRAITFNLAPVRLDLDIYDQYYQQIVVLDKNHIIAGARLFPQDYALRLGLRLYTESLYQITPAFYRFYQGLLEIRRMFVAPGSQGQYRP